ncbi:MAG: PLP-dependent aminotransferase family protein [Gammaproteobacteria bacterium]
MHFALSGIVDLRASSATPLHRQLYRQLRRAIVDGALPSGERLPSTRAMAQNLRVSRNTVVEAFAQLQSEGFIESAIGSGTLVAPLPARTKLQGEARKERVPFDPRGPSRRGQALAAIGRSEARTTPRAFKSGQPAIDLFPHKLWARLLGRAARAPDLRTLVYGQVGGLARLREVLAHYLRHARGVRAEPAQILVCSSAQGALDLIARVTLDPGDVAWLEDPGYLGARAALTGAGARIEPIAVDAHGLRVPAVTGASDRAPRLIYVTPSHQYPTGATLSLDRRFALLEAARTRGAYIVEDDYDSEFHFAGRPIAALQGLDDGESVLYVGTFAKTMLPGIRAAYIVAPPLLVDTLEAALRNSGHFVSAAVQSALADFISEGHFAAHLRRMSGIYAERRDALEAAFAEHLSGTLTPLPSQSGMQLCTRLASARTDDVTLVAQLLERGVATIALSDFCLGPRQNGLLLGFAAPDVEEIRAGVQTLASVLSLGAFSERTA